MYTYYYTIIILILIKFNIKDDKRQPKNPTRKVNVKSRSCFLFFLATTHPVTTKLPNFKHLRKIIDLKHVSLSVCNSPWCQLQSQSQFSKLMGNCYIEFVLDSLLSVVGNSFLKCPTICRFSQLYMQRSTGDTFSPNIKLLL